MCNNDSVEDELHFLFVCDKYLPRRQQLLNIISAINPGFLNLSNIDKLKVCFNEHIYHFASYLKDIYRILKETRYNVHL